MFPIITKLMSLILSLIMAFCGVQTSVFGSTSGTPITATQRQSAFDDGKLYIGGYYGTYDELSYAPDAGIDFLIARNVDKAYLDKALKLGVGVIAGGYSGLYSFYGSLSAEQASTWINYNYQNLPYHDALWGVDLIDEPNAPSFANIQSALKAFYDNTTGLLPLVNLFPSYASEEQLGNYTGFNALQRACGTFTDQVSVQTHAYRMHISDYVNTIDTDYICVDYYPYRYAANDFGVIKETTNSDWIRNLDLLAQACRDTGRKLFVITQAAGESNDISTTGMRWCDEKPEISQQMYLSLAFGAKAVIHALFGDAGWWQEGSHMMDKNGNPTDTYYAVKAVNADVKAFADEWANYDYVSTYLLNYTRIAAANNGDLNVEADEEKGRITSCNGLAVGTFDDINGSKGYIVVNMEELADDVTATFNFAASVNEHVAIYQNGVRTNLIGGKTLTLAPGEGVFITVTP